MRVVLFFSCSCVLIVHVRILEILLMRQRCGTTTGLNDRFTMMRRRHTAMGREVSVLYMERKMKGGNERNSTIKGVPGNTNN